MIRSLALPALLLAALAATIAGCAPDVVGGTRQVEEDCTFGCEQEREDPYGDGGDGDGDGDGAGGGDDDGATTGTGGAPGAGGAGGGGGTGGEGGAGGGGGAGGAGGG